MVAYIATEAFMTKVGKIKKGQIVYMAPDQAERLLAAGKIAEVKPCDACGQYAWWLSTHGVLVCGACHPSASSALIKKWLGDPDALKQIKADRGTVTLSWQDVRDRKGTHQYKKTFARGKVGLFSMNI